MNGGSGNWSLGAKYGPKDLWTNEISKEEWALQLLEGHYDYVFLARADNNFWSHYAELFENPTIAKSRQLFKVQQKGNGVLLVAR
jgi:hypothetical protein